MSIAIRYSDYMEAKALSEPTRSAKRTKLRLKASIARVLDKTDFNDVRVSDICKATGASQGTFYLYFKNKQDAVFQVIKEYVELQKSTIPPLDAEHPFDELYRFTNWFQEFFRANIGLQRTLMQLRDKLPDFGEIYGESLRYLTTHLVNSLKSHYAKNEVNDDMLKFAVYCAGSILDQTLYAVYAVRRQSEFDKLINSPNDLTEMIALLLYRALYGEEPPKDRLTTTIPLLRTGPS